jgi:glycosyltransferase involved in cell wall biosynthesis
MKISVVMSTYNRSKDFLPEAIKSILRQTETDFELIIVDDGSTDKTKKVVGSFKDPRITYIRMPENTGSDTQPKNKGASRANGEFLMFVDDDVVLEKDALKILSEELLAHKQYDIVYGDMLIVFPDGREEPGIRSDFNGQLLLLRNYIDTSTAMMRHDAFMEVGGFDTKLPKFIDWNLWVRLMKAGFKFKRIPQQTLRYFIHEKSKSIRVKTDTYIHPKLGELYVPTFDPFGCKWFIPNFKQEKRPNVAIFTIHYDRYQYSKETYEQMIESAGYPFRWFCVDNGSKDQTKSWLTELTKKGKVTAILNDTNEGITKASNLIIDEITRRPAYDIVIKIDNDVTFQTKNWLKDIVELWKTNTMLYISPYVEGLVHNPGGAPRVGYGQIGQEYIEITHHIGGLFAAVDARAYKNFRWQDSFLHGNQDMEASQAFMRIGYMPCYYPKHRITHKDTTEGQWDKYPEYFERRKLEKQTSA